MREDQQAHEKRHQHETGQHALSQQCGSARPLPAIAEPRLALDPAHGNSSRQHRDSHCGFHENQTTRRHRQPHGQRVMKHEGYMSDDHQHGGGNCQKQQHGPACAQAIGAPKDRIQAGARAGGWNSHAVIVCTLYGMLTVIGVSQVQ
jgi:hypothetical protein